MKNLNKKVSIILPVYNAADYLHACIESILNQTYKNIEIIAVDDESKDNSYAILTQYAKKDKRLKVLLNSKNLGVSKTMNRAIKNITGEYLAIMNADDIMMTNRIEEQVKFLENNPEYILTGSQVKMIDKKSKLIRIKQFPTTDEGIKSILYLANPIQHSSMTVNLSNLPKNFEWYSENMAVSEDIDLLFKLIQYGKFANSKKILIKYRVHSDSYCQQDPKKMYRLSYKARKNGTKVYGYKPTFKDVLFLESSMFAINLIPARLIFPTFFLIRKVLLKLGNLKSNNVELIRNLPKILQ